ncbi:MAG: hypothetical protein KDK62_00820 [Chlamydiia bacterium]|nr:hypothetical protein [Chlamydiia bacterium]
MAAKFLLSEGLWIGEGKISFSFTQDHLHFYTRWTPEGVEDGVLKWIQEVEMGGENEKVINYFSVTPLTDTTFSISYQNDTIGKAIGKGLLEESKIAWEIKSPEAFHGFEVYELQENGDYLLHAEYTAEDNFRTLIDGRIWMKAP